MKPAGFKKRNPTALLQPPSQQLFGHDIEDKGISYDNNKCSNSNKCVSIHTHFTFI